MAKKGKEQQYLSLKLMFDSGNVKRMKDIEKLYPTMVAKDMKTNHGRYIAKLYNPERFTINQVIKLALLMNVDANIISKIIITETLGKGKQRSKK